MGTVDCRFLTACVLQCNFFTGGREGGKEGVACTPWPAGDGGCAGTEDEGAYRRPDIPGRWRRLSSSAGLPSSSYLGRTPGPLGSFSKQSLRLTSYDAGEDWGRGKDQEQTQGRVRD